MDKKRKRNMYASLDDSPLQNTAQRIVDGHGFLILNHSSRETQVQFMYASMIMSNVVFGTNQSQVLQRLAKLLLHANNDVSAIICHQVRQRIQNSDDRPVASIKLPCGVTVIPKDMFRMLDVKKMILPSSLRVIHNHAFCGSSLLEIYIPDSVTHLGSHVFFCCMSLRRARLPKKIRRLPSYLFANCTKLKDVVPPYMELETVNKTCFIYCSSLATSDTSAIESF